MSDGPDPGIGKRPGLDYDDSVVPGQIVANILHLPAVTAKEAGDITIALRWSYGSAFGVAHVLLRKRLREPLGESLFGSLLMTMTSAAFPLLGRTPSPWRWPLDVQVSAIGSHGSGVHHGGFIDG